MADPARILVVDDDPWIQRMVATVLGHRGHEVTCVDGAEQARAALGGGLPALVIVAGTLPDGRGEALVSALRREGRMIEGVPALLLAGTGEDGVRPVDPRMDAVLGKPFRVEDLETAVERTLTLGRQRAATAAGGVAMAGMGGFAGLPGRPTPLPPSQAPPPMPAAAVEGDLGAIGLPTVLLLLEMEHKTGALHLAGPAPETAELVLRKGRVIRAYVFGPGSTVAGADAVYRTLTWNEGWFSFHPVDVEGADEIQAATGFLLIEGARRMDQAAEGDPDIIVEEVDL